MADGTLSFAEALEILGAQDEKNQADWLAEQKRKKEENSAATASLYYASHKFKGDEKPGTFHGNIKERLEDLFNDEDQAWMLIETRACKSTTPIFIPDTNELDLYKTTKSIVPNPNGLYVYGWARFKNENNAVVETDPMLVEKVPHTGHHAAHIVFTGYLNTKEECRRHLYEAFAAARDR